jgi:hypothetical protein
VHVQDPFIYDLCLLLYLHFALTLLYAFYFIYIRIL